MANKVFRLVRLSVSNSETRYRASYQDPKTKEIVVCTPNKTVKRFYSPEESTKERVFQLIFEPRRVEHNISIDVSNPEEVNFINALKKDPNVKTTANNRDGCRFELIDDEEEATMALIDIKARVSVCNKVLAMNISALTDLCFFFNYNIVGMTKGGILSYLLHPMTGALWQNIKVGNVLVDPKEIINHNKFGEDFVVKTNVNKAVLMGIITISPSGTYVYGDNSSILGSTLENVYSYFKTNKALFEGSLLPAVQASDRFEESIDFSAPIEEVEAKVKQEASVLTETDILAIPTWNVAQRAFAEKEAKSYGIQGNIAGMKEDTLREKLETARGRGVPKKLI